MKNITKDLINNFKKLEDLEYEISKIDLKINKHINLFDDPKESKNPEVIKLLRKKELSITEYNSLKKETKNIINIKSSIMGLKTDYFIKKFSTVQKRLDYINEKFKNETILEGTRDLFTSLAYDFKVKSYSPFNVMYVVYKFPKIFKESITIIYNKNEEDVEYELTKEKIINPGFEGEEEYK